VTSLKLMWSGTCSGRSFRVTLGLDVHLDYVRMPAGNGKRTEKMKGRPLTVLSAIKRSIVVVKAAFLCLAHAFIMAVARVNGDPKYTSYRDGYLLDLPVECLLNASGSFKFVCSSPNMTGAHKPIYMIVRACSMHGRDMK